MINGPKTSMPKTTSMIAKGNNMMFAFLIAILHLPRKIDEINTFHHYTIENRLVGVHMGRVLHVGPCNTPGGMAKVIEILSQNPPKEWSAETFTSHIKGNVLNKILFHRKAISMFNKLLNGEKKPDIVHIHTAADWSWKRKSNYVKICQNNSIPYVIHIHSGKFDQWLQKPNSKRSKAFKKLNNSQKCQVVVLTKTWKEKLQPMIGDCTTIGNPIDPTLEFKPDSLRKQNQILLLGRNDRVKGHQFAIKACSELRSEKYPELELVVTGTDIFTMPGVSSREWVSEQEKKKLLQESSILIIPSGYEGQPMTMLESLQCGLTCIASDRILDIPKSVIQAKYEDLADWKEKITHTLENPVDGKELNDSIKHHSIEILNQLWKSTYDGLLK